jgi:H+-transporting ATPase
VLMLMLMLITLLNYGTQISIGYDHAVPSKYPNAWNLRAAFTIVSVLASMALLSSLLILFLCIDSWRDDSFFQQTGLGGLSYGQITTVVYLKNSISEFSARNHEGFFISISKCKFDCN